ncbi:inositol monophosphatase [Halopseudomonas aestusnigri]|jgi:myo-inositol-1(or 4)-monophosphatase|uniref:inositol monophosphatase family protein n=1 Tax=Halopseudomonas aestusnigri TaxID=857252 RepID=UPI000C4A289F|nr:inositol monophosphatase [Pseudomonadales bacterium]MAP76040.1 inositol monophosphatase [Pseudomonadales bacterium]MAY07690.1 inositol monophosphatase [Pseudomonadales bacterium]HBT58481.1 inositol monophosphatase [Pseudomonas sp.]HCP03823.1 inositol monophosphatase [Pseudomonas sp.]|tara:strand:- start:3518 stop:4333 length:816 start_codon:yes stop_codon:yes gene_type:complete
MHDASEQDLDSRYQLACQLAREAAQRGLTLYRQRDQLAVEHKGGFNQDMVSAADRELEDLIRTQLMAAFPEDGFVGEETGAERLDARCVWVVDPIDGTACFLHGLHNWCVSIGLLVDGVPTIGVVADPNHDEVFHGGRGFGAWVNAQPMRVSDATDLHAGLLGVGTFYADGKQHFMPFLGKLLDAGGMFLRNGSGALMTAYVAAGRLLGYYETRLKSWDCVAGLALLAESGGRSNNFLRGEGLLKGNPYLVACPGVYDQVAGMIGPSLEAD